MQQKLEAILFYKNEPLTYKELSKMLGVDEQEIKEGIGELKQSLENRGLSLIENGEEVSLATSSENSELIERIAKEELKKEIGKAGLETLSIVLYKGAASRRDIDYIRGVNSNFTLRALLIRGLIKKTESENDGRSYMYKPTVELLSYLGIESVEKLPQYEKVREDLEKINDQ